MRRESNTYSCDGSFTQLRCSATNTHLTCGAIMLFNAIIVSCTVYLLKVISPTETVFGFGYCPIVQAIVYLIAKRLYHSRTILLSRH